MRAPRRLFGAAVLCGLLLVGCERDLVVGVEPSARFSIGLDLSTLAPAAGACVTVMGRVVLLVDGQVRGAQPVVPSDTLLVSFEAVEVRQGQEIRAEVLSNTGAVLFANGAVFEGQPRIVIQVLPQAPVLWACPAALVLDSGAEREITIRNEGRGTLSWSLVPLTQLAFSRTEGQVGAGQSMSVFVARNTNQAATLSLQIGSPEGSLVLPIAVTANRPPFLVNPIGDVTLAPGQTYEADLAAVFQDPDGDPLFFDAASADTSVARVSRQGSQLLVTARAEGTAIITVSAEDGFASAAAEFLVTVQAPDLTIEPHNDIQGPEAYCGRDNQGRLEVKVRNAGAADAQAPFDVQVIFSPGGDVRFRFGLPLPAGQLQILRFPIPGVCFDGDCDFTIIADPNEEVQEADENNNKVAGRCLG